MSLADGTKKVVTSDVKVVQSSYMGEEGLGAGEAKSVADSTASSRESLAGGFPEVMAC